MAAKTEDLPGVEGPGVSPVKDKKLNALADEFTEKRDEKANLAEEVVAAWAIAAAKALLDELEKEKQ